MARSRGLQGMREKWRCGESEGRSGGGGTGRRSWRRCGAVKRDRGPGRSAFGPSKRRKGWSWRRAKRGLISTCTGAESGEDGGVSVCERRRGRHRRETRFASVDASKSRGEGLAGSRGRNVRRLPAASRYPSSDPTGVEGGLTSREAVDAGGGEEGRAMRGSCCGREGAGGVLVCCTRSAGWMRCLSTRVCTGRARTRAS